MKRSRPPALDVELTQLAAFKSGRTHREINDDRHSYQISIYGRECTRRLINSNVLVSGMEGLRCEIAKNLVLAGVNSVTIHDESDVTLWDLSGSFIFSEDDLGKNKAMASIAKLQEINNSVLISAKTTVLVKEELRDFQVVVFTNTMLEKAVEFNKYCHQHQPPIAFIRADVRGLFASVFCDFGPKFTVFDVNGEDAYSSCAYILKETRSRTAVSIVHPSPDDLGFRAGDKVVFSQIRGMEGLCDGRPRVISTSSGKNFCIEEDAMNYSVISPCGGVKKVESKELMFKPLHQALYNPGDFSNNGGSLYHHLAFQALDEFIGKLRRLPFSGFEGDAKIIIDIFVDINNRLPVDRRVSINRKLLRDFAFGARAVLSPMATIFGAIVGQEALKACSGKFHPFFQFFYFDSIESLPSESLNSEDLKPMSSRYDAQISVFGSKLQKKMEESKIFVVGSGTLGCEFLKQVALMGVCTGDSGKLTITDDGFIEASTIARQFMFSDQNIGQLKSNVAASAALLINPRINVQALQNRACPDSEDVMDNWFWEDFTVVINALDNIKEQYVDYINKRCLYFRKALLDSATLGSKCRTRTIIPCLTDNSSASLDRLRNYEYLRSVYERPLNMEHCLSWAKSQFDILFDKTPNEANRYLTNPHEYLAAMRHGIEAKYTLHNVHVCLEDHLTCDTFSDCLSWACHKYHQYFVHDIMMMRLVNFDKATFAFVRPIEFGLDEATLEFIKAAAILRSTSFGIPIPSWVDDDYMMSQAVGKVVTPKYEVNKETCFRFTTEPRADDATLVNEIVPKLEISRGKVAADFRMHPIQFDKDGDRNYHMELVYSLASFRAKNFGIDSFKMCPARYFFRQTNSRVDASRPIASGLVCLELYKVIDGKDKIESYRNTCVDIAVPSLSTSQPLPPTMTQFKGINWTVWKLWELGGDKMLEVLIHDLSKVGITVATVAFGHHRVIYNSLKDEHQERKQRTLPDLVRQFARADLRGSRYFYVVVSCYEDIVLPLIRIRNLDGNLFA
ncbi:hypothetical protein ACP275_12G077400 [Erythranthe tilingii]